MSLRRKDDWDDALEEANRNKPEPARFVPPPDYDYAVAITINQKTWGDVVLDKTTWSGTPLTRE